MVPDDADAPVAAPHCVQLGSQAASAVPQAVQKTRSSICDVGLGEGTEMGSHGHAR